MFLFNNRDVSKYKAEQRGEKNDESMVDDKNNIYKWVNYFEEMSELMNWSEMLVGYWR